MAFLTETSALTHIARALAATKEAHIAVAFWGAGVVDRLGLARTGLKLTVVCNLQSGLCNPDEIKRLTALGADVRSNTRLHGKVYWTPDAVFIGSSNASTKGLVMDGQASPGWSEANVRLTDAATIATARQWIDEQWASGDEISTDLLETAAALWKARSQSAPLGLQPGQDLLAAFNHTPDHPAWRRLKVVVWSKDLSLKAQRSLSGFQASGPAFKAYGAYEDWHEAFDGGDWLIELDLSSGHPKVASHYWQTPEPKLEDARLTYVRPSRAVELPGWPPLKLSASDKARIVAIAPRMMEADGRGRVLRFAEVVALLAEADDDRLRGKPSAKKLHAFHEAMLESHRRARELDYRGYSFKQQLDELGGWAFAKKILGAKNRSLRLMRLGNRGRIDLSVEALVQRPEWRELFSEDELFEASKRCSSVGVADCAPSSNCERSFDPED